VSYCEGSNGNYTFDVAHATTISQPLQDARTQQSNIYTLLIAKMTATSILVILHEATMMMVDCGKGMQDCAMQQPTKY
jgi:hypothetical protein